MLSHLDLSLSTLISGEWRRFAILEFKRPGAIKFAEWQPVMGQPGTLGPGAVNICRQLHKYAYACNTPFGAVCDGLTLVLMKFGGSRHDWYNAQPQRAIPNSAVFRWITDRSLMKRNLYVWAREAYMAIVSS